MFRRVSQLAGSRIRAGGPTRLSPPPRRSAFTLIEMVVTIGIILILTTFVVVSVNLAASSDRLAGSARQVQSYLEGARDRAIFAKAPRGVRFLLNEQDNTLVTSLVYIGPPENSEGTLTVAADGRTLTLDGGDSWSKLEQLGVLLRGARIRISNGGPPMAANALWYTIESLPSDLYNAMTDPPPPALAPDRLRISRNHVDNSGSAQPGVAFELALIPAVLPDQEPVQLSTGIVIDLDNSQTPGSWKYGNNFTNTMDIMFSPRGNVTGPSASTGLVHLLLRDIRDVELGIEVGNYDHPERKGDERLVSVFTRTGNISIHPVKQNDPYFYSETGEVNE